MVAEAKQRRIKKADWDKVEGYIKKVYKERKDADFRAKHEGVWKEVDRQIAMETMQRVDEAGKPRKPDWHNVLELGELSKASEVITSDVMRITFPNDRAWYQPHVKVDWPTNPQNGQAKSDPTKQKIIDGVLRSMMSQQHSDFGLKARVRLSMKEALHHGSFVAEARFTREMMVKDGGKVKIVGAPVWQPYSMWNAYPDPSPSVIGTNMFYTGSMILIEFMPLWKFKQMAKGDGWMTDRLSKIEAEEHTNKNVKNKDVELLKFIGDISIERGDGDIFLPNSCVYLANQHIVYYAPNELPFSPVIYSGYERQDIRDPYYTSPIIKQSPMQKFTSIMANRFADATDLKVEPPIEYDGNDPDYVANDGPTIAPGAKTATKSMGNGMKILDIGDPKFALEAMQFGLQHMQQGTGVSALRSGMTNSDRQTATEVTKVAQGAEVRTIEFIAQVEPCLRTFLYMQHELNRMHMDEYEFYNDEMHTPDYMTITREQIDKNAQFEIVGSRGVLGEEQRTQRTTAVTAFASQNPLFAPLLKPLEILISMYRDAGEKNPEGFVKIDQQGQQGGGQQAMQQVQQMAEAIKQKEAELQQVEEQLKKQANDLALKTMKQQFESQLLALREKLQSELSKHKTNHEQALKQLNEAADYFRMTAEKVTHKTQMADDRAALERDSAAQSATVV